MLAGLYGPGQQKVVSIARVTCLPPQRKIAILLQRGSYVLRFVLHLRL